MGQIAVAPEQDEDRLYEEAEQRARDRLTFPPPPAEAEDRLDPARGMIFGTLCGIALITWAGFAIWKWFV